MARSKEYLIWNYWVRTHGIKGSTKNQKIPCPICEKPMAFASLNKKDTRFGWSIAMIGNLTVSNDLIKQSLNRENGIDRKKFMPVHISCLEEHHHTSVHEADLYTM